MANHEVRKWPPYTAEEQGAWKSGDTLTIAGVYELIPNRDKRWWQFWKPKKVRSDRLKVYTVI